MNLRTMNYTDYPELQAFIPILPVQHPKAPRPSFSEHYNQGSGFESHHLEQLSDREGSSMVIQPNSSSLQAS